MATARQQQAQQGRRTTLRNSFLLFFFCEPHVSAQAVVIHFNELNIFGFSNGERMLDTAGVRAVEHLVQMASHIMTQHIDVVHFFFFSCKLVYMYISEMRDVTNRMDFPTQFEKTKDILRIPNFLRHRCVSSKQHRKSCCHGNDGDPSRTRPPSTLFQTSEQQKRYFYRRMQR